MIKEWVSIFGLDSPEKSIDHAIAYRQNSYLNLMLDFKRDGMFLSFFNEQIFHGKYMYIVGQGNSLVERRWAWE